MGDSAWGSFSLNKGFGKTPFLAKDRLGRVDLFFEGEPGSRVCQPQHSFPRNEFQ